MFKKVEPKFDLPKIEKEILEFWEKEKIFEKSLEIRKGAPLYSFYDGPPFATGTPHYGHILVSVMKDTVPRYFAMKGYYVPRVWGWDCHGLPIENIAEKELGIKTKKEIYEYGVDKFNEFCRSKVSRYADEWKIVIRRLGRWVDMEHSYKTMDLDYMESVWWVFKQLWDKGLIYEGRRSIHICPRCETTLSQTEVAEGYKEIKDLSVIAEFKLTGEPDTSVLAWTTTPWTLFGNVALAIGKDIDYVKIEKPDEGRGDPVKFILAKDRLQAIFPDGGYKIVDELKGVTLAGKKYKPLFETYDKSINNFENGWQILAADFVSTEEGTGVVHIAPAFGEDDMKLGETMKLPFIQHVGMDGIIKDGYGEFSGLSVKPADDVKATDKKVIEYLKEKDLLFSSEEYEHSYPHCWRCDTPLLNYVTTSWFVNVIKIKEQMLTLAKEINWSPKHIKDGRFGKWLEGARDWSISRQRFWASVIPVWKCQGTQTNADDTRTNADETRTGAEGCREIKVVGSVEELNIASGQKVTDLHKHIVDKIKFKCEKCGSEMSRVPDVLDTWFDSGSMPYGENHYPFENKEKLESNIPAEFIGEGIDQTRAWFYYLHLISTAIFDKPAFKNALVNGIVLGSDGKKMSKKLNNYPDPMLMFEKYGADVLRYYLISSPVVAAENLNFREEELVEIHRGMFRMLWNSYSFFIMYAALDNYKPAENLTSSENILDRWIISETEKLNLTVDTYMEKYDLIKASRQFSGFIDNLSNWYIRRSRKRFWKSENDDDKNNAFNTLYYVITKLTKLLAPFMPYLTDEIYKNLTDEESVHLADYPKANEDLINDDLNLKMILTRTIVELGLAKRSEEKIKVRQPLKSLTYFGQKLDPDFEMIIAEEVNIKEVKNVSTGNEKEIELDTELTEELRYEGMAREIIRQIQSLRKEAGFQVSDRINTYFQTDDSNPEIKKSFEKEEVLIKKETLSVGLTNSKTEVEFGKDIDLEGKSCWIGVSRTKQ